MASGIYASFKRDIMDGTIDLDTDTIKVALVTATYSPNFTTHDRFDDITNEVVGTGYTAGGAALSSKVVSLSGTTGKFDAADTTWAGSSITARAAVVYKSTGTSSTSPLICYLDFGGDKTTLSGDFVLQYNASGIVNIA